jgi:hypothetical protein
MHHQNPGRYTYGRRWEGRIWSALRPKEAQFALLAVVRCLKANHVT